MKAETFTENDRLLAKRLCALRQLSGFTQKAVAHQAGLHEYSIRDIENYRRRVYAVELANLARIYGVTVGSLLGESDSDVVKVIGPDLFTIIPRLNGDLKMALLAYAQFLLWSSGRVHHG